MCANRLVRPSGNFHVYDPEAKILMSGDVGAALEADGAPLEVEDFDEHIPRMKLFHQRWMPSNQAKMTGLLESESWIFSRCAPSRDALHR